jgi:hypothetical protein
MTTHQHLLYTCRQYRLLIAGSRQATPVMLERAAQAVERAKARGWAILVGDNPLGVDAAVVAACNRFHVNYVCFGISAKPRNQQIRTVQQGGSGRYLRVAGADYAARDRNMADVADQGCSSGMNRAHRSRVRHMQQFGKPADRLTSRPSIRLSHRPRWSRRRSPRSRRRWSRSFSIRRPVRTRTR